MDNQSLWKILEGLEKSHSCAVAVIGDLMLDRYIYGAVTRISPEAPIPVVKFQRERCVPGGAGNVVANLCGLGAAVKVFGCIGPDREGQMLNKLLSSLLESRSSVDCTNVVHLFSSGCTTVKTRIIGGTQQQMLRLDREEPVSLSSEQEQTLIRQLFMLCDKGLKSILLSDYGKGVCSPELCRDVIDLCHVKHIPVFVDPKGKDWSRYSGAELVTPNLTELADAVGVPVLNDDEAILQCGKIVREKYGLKNLLITRSEKGATFIGESGYFHKPSRAVDVFDVSGAGDTMISTVAFLRSSGVDWLSCVKLANIAAQLVIGKAGTCPITYRELKDACHGYCVSTNRKKLNKFYSVEAMENLCDSWKREGKRVVFTNGCFDVFHAGHVDSLVRARALGDRLIVGVNSDASVRRLKGPKRPINSQDKRIAVLEALECVDAVVAFSEDTPEELLSRLRPNVIAKGGDYRPSQVAGRQFADEVIILPLVKGLSSTSIIAKLGEKT